MVERLEVEYRQLLDVVAQCVEDVASLGIRRRCCRASRCAREFFVDGIVRDSRLDIECSGRTGACTSISMRRHSGKRGFEAAPLAVGGGDVEDATHNARVDGTLRDFDRFIFAEARTSFADTGHRVGDLPNLG